MTVVIRNWETGATITTLLETSNCVGAQFAGMNLANADFTDLDVRLADFTGADLSYARFARAKTGGAVFTGATLTSSDFTDQDATVPPYTLSLVHASAFNTNPQNNKGWRNYSVFTHVATGYQYCVFYRRIQGRVVVARRQVLDGAGALLETFGAWTVAESTTQSIANSNDGHHVATIVVDGLGTVIVAWSWLDTGMRLWWGDAAGDMNVDEQKALPIVAGESALEANPVYPEWTTHPSLGDDVLLTYWQAGNPEPNTGTHVRRWSAASKTFTSLTPAGLLKCGFNAYLFTRVWDSQGRLWIPFCWRDSASWDNHDLGVVISDPADGPIGTVWRDRDGNLLTLPVQPTSPLNAERYTIADTEGMQNSGGFCLAAGERPVWSTFKGDPANFWIVNERADGTTVGRQVGTQGLDFTLVGSPSVNIFPLCQPRLLYRDGFLYAFFRSDTYKGLWCYVLSDADLASPSSLAHREPVQICAYDAGAYAPNWDETLYEATGALHFFISRASETDTDLGAKTPAFILELDALPEVTMGILTSPACTALVDHIRNKAAYTPAANHYAHAFIAGVEVTGNNYSAAANANNKTTWSDAAGRAITNDVAFTFPNPSGTWGLIDEIRITDNATPGAGTELARHTLNTPVTIDAASGPLVIDPGDIDISCPAGSFTDTVVHEMLDLMFGATANAPRATTYGSYWAGDPQGAGAQASAARVALTQATTWGDAVDGQSVSIAAVTLADEVTGTYWAEHTASVAGTLLFSKLLPATPSGGGVIPPGVLRTLLS